MGVPCECAERRRRRGLITIVLPAISAGGNLNAIRMSGKFHCDNRANNAASGRRCASTFRPSLSSMTFTTKDLRIKRVRERNGKTPPCRRPRQSRHPEASLFLQSIELCEIIKKSHWLQSHPQSCRTTSFRSSMAVSLHAGNVNFAAATASFNCASDALMDAIKLRQHFSSLAGLTTDGSCGHHPSTDR